MQKISYNPTFRPLILALMLVTACDAFAQSCPRTVQGSRGIEVTDVRFTSSGVEVDHWSYHAFTDGTDAQLKNTTTLTDQQVADRARTIMGSGSGVSGFTEAFQNAMGAEGYGYENGEIETDPDIEMNGLEASGACDVGIFQCHASWSGGTTASLGEIISHGNACITDNAGLDHPMQAEVITQGGTIRFRDNQGIDVVQCAPEIAEWDQADSQEVVDNLEEIENPQNWEERDLPDSEIADLVEEMGPSARRAFFSTATGRPDPGLFGSDITAGGQALETCSTDPEDTEEEPPEGEPEPPDGPWVDRPGSGTTGTPDPEEEDEQEEENRSGCAIFGTCDEGEDGGGDGEGLTIGEFCDGASGQYAMCESPEDAETTIEEFCSEEGNFQMCQELDTDAVGDLETGFGDAFDAVDTGVLGPLDAMGDDYTSDQQGFTDASGSCPAPIQVETAELGLFSNATLAIELDTICQVTTNYVKPVLILFATWGALAIVVGARGPSLNSSAGWHAPSGDYQSKWTP